MKTGPTELKTQMTQAERKVKIFTKTHINISLNIKRLMASFQLLANRGYRTPAKKLKLRRVHKSVSQVIQKALIKFRSQINQLKALKAKLEISSDKKVKIIVKKINAVVQMILSGIQEAENANKVLKVILSTL